MFECSEKLRECHPVARIHIECFHSSTTSALGEGTSNLLTRWRCRHCRSQSESVGVFRSEKIVTFTDQQQIPLTSWTDETDWPRLEDLAGEGFAVVGVSVECQVEGRDGQTRTAVDSFRNKFVEQNCHKDDEIK